MIYHPGQIMSRRSCPGGFSIHSTVPAHSTSGDTVRLYRSASRGFPGAAHPAIAKYDDIL